MALTLTATNVARATEVDTYIYWKTAELVDAQCHYLKSVERQILDKLIDDALWAIPQYQDYLYGIVLDEDYKVWSSAIESRAETIATGVGCTAAAEPYLLAARDAASRLIYQDLLILFHYNSLPAEDPQRVPLPADQMQAAHGYAQYLNQLYGANFNAFAAAQRQAATQRQMASSSTLRAVHFEVVAEVAGYRVWPEKIANTELIALHPVGSTEISGVVVEGPSEFPVGKEDKLNGVLVRMLDGALWLMSYGEVADALATKPVKLVLLVRTGALPEGQSIGDAWARDDWRGLTTSFELSPVSASCLGGPCWSVPEEGKAAMLASSQNENAELWISTDPDAVPDRKSEASRRGGIFAGPIFAAEGIQRN